MSEKEFDLTALLAAAAPTALLSVDALAGLVQALARPMRGQEDVPLQACVGRVLARALGSRLPLPVFDHSAMDGFAVALAPGRAVFTLVGRTAAGDVPGAPLAPGEAVRIFTGAPIPAGADAVVMQEHVDIAGIEVRALRAPRAGDHIRRAGEDVAAGETLVAPGTVLDARHIALLAAVGVAHVPVRPRPRVAVLSTGSELRPIGQELAPGAIFDANRPMLLALLARSGADLVDAGILPDQPQVLRDFLIRASDQFDVLVTSGGTSVGEEDFLAQAIRLAGGQAAPAALAVKPGKPALLGVVGDLRITGLPGNPFAAMVAGLLLARPLVQASSGTCPVAVRPGAATAGFSHDRQPGRTEFFPAAVTGIDEAGRPVIDRLGRGGSARLKPLIPADGLGVIPAADGPVTPGSRVGFLPFQAAFGL
jgi:molybdopterin molybdotransferase